VLYRTGEAAAFCCFIVLLLHPPLLLPLHYTALHFTAMKINYEFKIILWAHAILAVFLIYKLFDLFTLLYDDSRQYEFLSSELNNQQYVNSQPQLIPKIIHQTYKTEEIPEHWKEGQQKCQDFNPDYQYILWTDEMARDFIAEQYPWFLKTFDSYPYPIQRADAIRYFILSHYGGIYIDLDDGCARPLDPLLTVPAFVRKTDPTGISNDVMGSVPNHPFFAKAISMLQRCQRNWFVPYITIMISTGPLYLSIVWQQYIRWGNPPSGVVRILMPEDYKESPNAFFKITKGSSWHNDDAAVLLLMNRHIPTTVILCHLFAFSVIYCEYLLVCLINRKYGSKISNAAKSVRSYIVNSLPANLNFLKGGYSSLSAVTGNGNGDEEVSLKPLYVPRKLRKDSNLPAALSVDLEKNVKSLNDIVEN
jgi:inositol phosphorylceramide mannosyltransferase catalytic subunit